PASSESVAGATTLVAVTLRVIVSLRSDSGSTGSVNVTRITGLSGTPTPPLTGFTAATCGLVTSVADPVVELEVVAAPTLFPARSVIAGATVAVYIVATLSSAAGVNVICEPETSIVPLTAPLGPVTDSPVDPTLGAATFSEKRTSSRELIGTLPLPSMGLV